MTERIWKLATILGIVTALTHCVVLPNRLSLVMPWPMEGVTVVDESSQSIFLVGSNENATENVASLGAASELPLQAAPELPAASRIEALTAESAASDWHALEDELLQLEVA